VNLPFYDQWDAEALGLYVPWLEGTLGWSDLLRPHNEHRILLTQLQNLTLFHVTGTWIPLLQQVLNAGWYSLLCGGLAYLCTLALPGRPAPLLAGGIALLMSAPYGWQNALWGFQSQHYFSFLLCVFALVLLRPDGATRARCVGGLSLLAASLFSSGSGTVFAAGISAAAAVLAVTQPAYRRHAVYVGVGALLVVGGGVLLASHVPAHDSLRARTVIQFLEVTFRGLAFPNVEFPWTLLVGWLPLLGLTVLAWRHRDVTTPPHVGWVVLSLTSIVLLHAASIAYARGGGLPGNIPLSRYQDQLALGPLVNAIALILLWQRTPTRSPLLRAVSAVWAGAFLIGMLQLSSTNLGVHLPFRALSNETQARVFTDYQRSRNATLLEQGGFLQLGHLAHRPIRLTLDNPLLASHLPLPLRMGGSATGWERSVSAVVAFAPWPLLLVGGLTLCLSARRLWARHRDQPLQLPPDANDRTTSV
jgi:hypothetical protein